ncbi:DEAD-box ATP-dependent RNA helicase [Musa troglodytarum]|uniref:DEAD-box ATP-dependent RNA helicase n=1 Tax=Musa troglodytarum TaxID=320322 RepID=A0A9E7EG45_9LILI|nr:DEAD-box ATP-dependent RNA helicase [Musa troglodytarum]
METTGACRLVDRETGEKFIVWGDSVDNDDADTPIPSAVVLSWKPPIADGRQEDSQIESATIVGDSSSSDADRIDSFGSGRAQVNEEIEATNSLHLNSREDDYASFLDRSVPRNASFMGWGDVGCTDDMAGALRGLMFLRPSHIQAMAYGPIIEGKTCIIADQSGSGGTLDYLAPTI